LSDKGNGHWVVLFLVAAMTSCGPEPSEETQAPLSEEELVRIMHDSRTDYYNNKDIVALMDTYTESAVVLSGTLQVASGLEAIEDLIGEEMDQSLGIQNDLRETLLFSNQAVLWGSYEWSGMSADGNAEIVTTGPYILELLKQEGSWKVAREMWTQDNEISGAVEWDVIPEDFVSDSEWSDEMDLLAGLYNRRDPTLLADFFSEDALVGVPNTPVMEGRHGVEVFFENHFNITTEVNLDVSVRSENILDEENVLLTGYLKTDAAGNPQVEGRSRFLLLLELANPFEVAAGEDAEWQIRWMIASGQSLF
jgi:ketosteroid isomerase-like protein